MKITVTFDSLEEFQSCMHLTPAIIDASVEKAKKPTEENAEAPRKAPEEPEAIKSTPKDEKPREEATEEQKKDSGKTVDRAEVRRILAGLNKKTGTNVASSLIAEFGCKRLTDVPKEKLPKLLKKAEEALNAD